MTTSILKDLVQVLALRVAVAHIQLISPSESTILYPQAFSVPATATESACLRECDCAGERDEARH